MSPAASRYGPDSPRIGGMALHAALLIVAVHLAADPQVPAEAIRGAQVRAVHILASAHVELVWKDEARLQMKITAGELPRASTDALGVAMLIPGYERAEVSWRAVTRAASQLEADPGILLGAALAHELGHMLFGPAHAPAGIMTSHLGHKEVLLAGQGDLLFR